MAGRHHLPPWDHLTAAPIRYDLATLMRKGASTHAFDPVEETDAERLKRVALLRSSAVPGAQRLASKLQCDDCSGPVPSLANPVYSRAWRRVEGSYLLGLISEARRAGLPVRAFTAVVPQHTFDADLLDGFHPTTVTSCIRRFVEKHLPQNPTGWAYMWVHGEYKGTSNTFVMHGHGIAAGDYLATLDGRPLRTDLRTLAGSHKGTPSHPTSPRPPGVRVPLRIDPLRNVPRQVSYVLQSWWPSRPVVLTPNGWKRVRDQGRIPAPHHSRDLVWLDRQSISSMRLRMGLGSGG